jgi:UDPglucose 6-dehydrogenase
MRVTVIGTGYVGLVTGACFADVGNDVLCLDVDVKKIEGLRRNELPIHEPGLETLVARNASSGRLKFSTSYDEASAFSTLVFIAVGTPPGEDGSADLSHVLNCARELGKRVSRNTLVVLKSTVPVGTNEKVRAACEAELAARRANVQVRTASNPEFLKEGAAVDDFMKPDRIIVGADDHESAETLRHLYAPFNRNRDRMVVMDIRSAEFTKYAANCMLAARISLMNEMANLADRLQVDIEHVRQGIGSDPRIGPQFLYAGVGFGGSCFPKDLRALIHAADEVGEPVDVLKAVSKVNLRQRSILAEKIQAHFRGDLANRTIALWGLAFKANTDDIREASSVSIIRALTAAGARVRAYDPIAMSSARAQLASVDRLEFANSARDALVGADALAVVTEWLEFRSPDFDELASTLKAKVIFDGRNLYDPQAVRTAGLTYFGIGRGKA